MQRKHPKRSRIGYQQLEDRRLLTTLAFSEFVDPNPNLDNGFGQTVLLLETGNVVVTSPNDDAGGTNAGAVYLFNGSTGDLISTLIGSSADDRISSNGVFAVKDGNYVVGSRFWDNGLATNAGALTFGNGTTGVAGVVSAANSLVGSSTDDRVGEEVTVLDNGNYIVGIRDWDNGGANDAGAVTFGNGNTGVTGIVSAANSLVGLSTDDHVSSDFMTVLDNGNFVVRTPSWDNGTAANAGAVTFADGNTGVTGVISAANSLIGSSADDFVGGRGIVVLENGNYVISSPNWDNGSVFDAGAVTFGDGNTGVTGVVSAANSLVGSSGSDQVGGASDGVKALKNGNYVVRIPSWDNGLARDAGAVTFGNGTTGVSGPVSEENSLVGSSTNDFVGATSVFSPQFGGLTLLDNGNYIVQSPFWDHGLEQAVGAVTFGDGNSGVTGVVSQLNSLVGSSAEDRVGAAVTVLANDNYVIRSPDWDNGSATDAGAVTFGDGTTGIVGVLSAANSLIGSSLDDQVGSVDVTELGNGNYVVHSRFWDNGTATNAGAVTFGDGDTGIAGVVGFDNSLVGSSPNDLIGNVGISVLENGNYVVSSSQWDNGSVTDVGAVTFGDGATGVAGAISAANSLVGSITGDRVGDSGVTVLESGNYVVQSSRWNNGSAIQAGAITFGDGSSGVKGVVSAANSLVGSSDFDRVGNFDVVTLGNGNYIIQNPGWDNGSSANAGAVTFGNGNSGVTGVVSAANSLVGSSENDNVGFIRLLENGNYIVISPEWDNGSVTDAGAVTFGDGITGVAGLVGAVNSLVGSSPNDRIGSGAVTPLENGNYVVNSDLWDNGSVVDAGAITLGNGDVGVTGAVSPINSLVGTGSARQTRSSGVFPLLTNSNYVIVTPSWNDNAGAVTFVNGTVGVFGEINAENSLIGSSTGDRVGGIVALETGNYLVSSPLWDNGSIVDAGAVTFGDASNGGVVGEIDQGNSVIGQTSNAGLFSSFSDIIIDDANDRFFASFGSDGSGRVWVGSQTTGFPVVTPSDAPVIRTTVVDGGGTLQRPDLWENFTVVFDRDVSISSDALSLSNDTLGGMQVDLSGAAFEYDPINFKARWTFDLANPLPAAFYTYSLDANSITANGFPLDGNGDGVSGDDLATQHYVAIPGDRNLDGVVDLVNDLQPTIGNLGTTQGAVWSDGDFNGDGAVDVVADVLTLMGNLNKSVVPVTGPVVLLGDVNQDDAVNFLDISPFVTVLSTNVFQAEADVNQDGVVDFLDIAPFIGVLSSPGTSELSFANLMTASSDLSHQANDEISVEFDATPSGPTLLRKDVAGAQLSMRASEPSLLAYTGGSQVQDGSDSLNLRNEIPVSNGESVSVPSMTDGFSQQVKSSDLGSRASFSYQPISFRATSDLSTLTVPLSAGYHRSSFLVGSINNSNNGQNLLRNYSDEFDLALAGDVNLDGTIDVVNDVLAESGILGESENVSRQDSDFNNDETVEVLDAHMEAFASDDLLDDGLFG